MIPITSFAGQSVALFGLGGSGLSTAKALAAGGALRPRLGRFGGRARQGRGRGRSLCSTCARRTGRRFKALVLAPGAPLTHPEPHWSAAKAHAAGVPVIGDIELFCRERALRAPGSPLVAITGTNGKSTTTALIAHILREAGFDVQLGGNIGTPILDLEPPSPERVQERVHVVECSSYQIDLAPSLDPSVGILLEPDARPSRPPRRRWKITP